MIRSSEGIVLRAMKYGETSRIVTAFTEEYGKVSLIAKGARGPKARFGAALEPMSRSHFVYYHRDNRDLQTVSHADLIRQYAHLIDDPGRVMLGFSAVEFLHAAIHGEEAQPSLYASLRDTLDRLDASPDPPTGAVIRFVLELNAALGFAINFSTCVSCGGSFDADERSASFLRYNATVGGFSCSACAPAAVGERVSPGDFRTLRRIAVAVPDVADAVHPSTPDSMRLLRLIHRHLAAHVPGMRRISSLELIEAFS